MPRVVVTSQLVTSLCNLDTGAISLLEYDFVTQTRKHDEKRSLSQLWPMGFNFSLHMLSLNKLVEENGLTSSANWLRKCLQQ